MELRRLRLSLLAVQLVGMATLVRSIAFDRWITVLASVLLLVGATAARRGRSWGVALSLGAASAFPVAWMIGIAPPWFALVGLVGALPFLLASRAFVRFDKGAAVLLASLAASLGGIGAVAWKEYAWSVFTTYPSLMPSIEAQHGFGILAVIAASVMAMRLGRGPQHASAGEGGAAARFRVADRLRVADVTAASPFAGAELDALDETEADRGHTSENRGSEKRHVRR